MLSTTPDPQLTQATRLQAAALLRQARRLAAQGHAPWLSELLAQRMAERLDWIKLDVSRVLQWQALHGAGHAALKGRYPAAQHSWVEEAGQGPAQALLKRPWWQRWAAPEAELLAPSDVPPGAAQLVWANQVIHTAPNPRALLAQWHAALAVDGFVMFSGLGPDSFKELRALYASQGWGPVTPQWVDLHDIGDMLIEAGFAEPVMDQERISLTWGDAEALWRDLALIGGNLHADRFAGLRTPRWRRRWLEAVNRLAGADGRIVMTLEFVCGHAIKPLPKLTVTGETRVSVDRMRDELRQRRP
jgi:malonyl-CoA O-methyltransferase